MDEVLGVPMPHTSPGEINALLSHLNDPASLNQVMQLVYGEIRRMASHGLRNDPAKDSMQTTELVNEIFLRLLNGRVTYENRAHFFGAASRTMRQQLVDVARRRGAQKRPSSKGKVELDETLSAPSIDPLKLLELDELLNRLEAYDPRLCQIVQLRVFGGFTAEEAANALGMPESTLRRRWSDGLAWLRKEAHKHLDAASKFDER